MILRKRGQRMMLRIAVCDEVFLYAQMLAAIVKDWGKQRCLNIRVESFGSGEEVLWELENSGGFHAVFLDVEMNGMGGVETAVRLRQSDRYVNIIFISRYGNYFRQMFEVYPCYYIEKPVAEKKIAEILDRTVDEHRYRYAGYYFRYKRRNYHILLRKVLYFSSEKRQIRIVMEDGKEYLFYEKLDVVEQQLADYEIEFIRIHKSFLVNSGQVEQFCSNCVVFHNGERVAVSQEYRGTIKRFCMNSLTEKY